MILYHYPFSPFSEKIRLMLSYTSVGWQGCAVPPMPPRRYLDDILGGYRRIPVAQIGADFYCDTRLIVDQIAASYGDDQFSYSRCDAAIRHFVERTNTTVFMAVVQTSQAKVILPALLKQYWPWKVVSLIRDRANVAKTNQMPRTSGAERQQIIKEWRTELEERLSQQEYLYGNKPTLADFAAYHIAWFADKTRRPSLFSPASAAGKWQRKMSSYEAKKISKVGWHEIKSNISGVALRAIPDAQKTHRLIDKQVSIGPDDYALDRVEGRLVGADQHQWIIERDVDDIGLVHIHFPQVGFTIKPK